MTILQLIMFLFFLPISILPMINSSNQEIALDPAGSNMLHVYLAKNQTKIDEIENDDSCHLGNCELYNKGCCFFVTGVLVTASSLGCWLDYAINKGAIVPYIGGALDVIGGSMLVGLAAKKGYNCIMPWYLKRKQQKLLNNYQSLV